MVPAGLVRRCRGLLVVVVVGAAALTAGCDGGSDADGAASSDEPATPPSVSTSPTTAREPVTASAPTAGDADEEPPSVTTTTESTRATPVSVPTVTATLDVAPQQLGFAGTQGLTGGLGRQVVMVTTADDGGPGSYREALAGGDRIVRFDPSLDGATIHLQSYVEAPGSNLTVDGSGVDVTISGHSTRFSGTNVVVAGMSYRYNDDLEDDDAVTFRDASTTQVVGLFGNHFETAGDGLVDVIWNGGNDVYVTMCGNLFMKHDKAVLIHSGDDDREGGTYYVTMCDNAWLDVYQRAPLSRQSLVHQFNSLFERYGQPDGHGGGSKAGGDGATASQHLLEHNVAIPRRHGEVTFDGSTTDSPRAEWAGPQLDNDSSVRIVGTFLASVDGTTATQLERNGDEVFTPPYDYSPVTATPELAEILRRTAGTCVPVGAERVSPCAPLELLHADDRLGVVVDSPDFVSSVAFVGEDLELPAEPEPGGRWSVRVGDIGGPIAVKALVTLVDGSRIESDVAVVAAVP